MIEAFDFGDTKRRYREAGWIVVRGEGARWLAFDEPKRDRRGVAFISEDSRTLFGAETRLSTADAAAYRSMADALVSKYGKRVQGLVSEALTVFG